MKKIVILFLLGVFFSLSAFSQEKYSKVRVFVNDAQMHQLSAAGIATDEGIYKKGVYFETDLSATEIARIKQLKFKYKIIVDNVAKFYEQRALAEKDLKIARSVNEEWPVPAHWGYGSMGGFYTLAEVMNELDSMAILYPDLISLRAPISNDTLTHEGRHLWWVRISDNPNGDEDEPEILYTAVHHAREPMGVQQMIWYMWYLLENYNTMPDIHTLVDNTEMYFVPIVNPDGYEYNHITNPNGGGMWRKTRSDNGDGSFGVDPNRNYNFMWGYDNNGSSPYPSNETYRGPYAFSEPCIKDMRDFTNEHEFKIAINYHAYSDMLLYPWGYVTTPSPDNELMHDYAQLMTKENGYVYGQSSTTIYPTNGDANDWMYGEQTTKAKILSYTPEIGSQTDGFWPSPNRIIPLCRDEMWQNIMAARLVGKYATLTGLSPVVNADLNNFSKFQIKRLGLTDCEDFRVFIQPLDDNIVAVGDTVHFYNMELMDIGIDSIAYTLKSNIEEGTMYQYLLSVFNGDYTLADTITNYFGTETVIFDDSAENMDNWTSSKWNITGNSYHSPLHSITDSPYGNYQNNQTNIINLDSVIDLRNVPMAFLRYWAKWNIEAGYDYVQVMVKDVNNSAWTALSGKYTKIGNANQAEGEPLYDGAQNSWVHEEIPLADFIGKQINLRFMLKSDAYVNRDGFYFDDFTFSVVSNTTGIAKLKKTQTGIIILSMFPNPVKDVLNITYKTKISVNQLNVKVFNASGKIVKMFDFVAGKIIKLDVSHLQSGLYYFRLSGNKLVSKTRKFVKL